MQPFVRRAVSALVFTALASASIVHAAFVPLDQQRSVSISGSITLVDSMGGDPVVASQSFQQATAVGDFGLFDAEVGLGTLVLDHPEGSASGNGRAAQRSSVTATTLAFDGVADVFVSGFANGASELFGSGGAASRFSLRFDVTEAVRVYLAMNSEIGPRANDYTFRLAREDGTVVWDQTELFDDNGPVRRFVQVLDLAPGVHTLDAALTASSFFSGDFNSSGRVLATFSLRPVPEADTATVLGAGLAGLALLATRRRQRERISPCQVRNAG
ncbi:MAG: hypothetical protein MUF30_12915 [Burkholderiales bacterium]|jgi:MYXO-CTERM domain-containing protein|nr:hypothetical protein [Burkholderiales bacterium]